MSMCELLFRKMDARVCKIARLGGAYGIMALWHIKNASRSHKPFNPNLVDTFASVYTYGMPRQWSFYSSVRRPFSAHELFSDTSANTLKASL